MAADPGFDDAEAEGEPPEEDGKDASSPRDRRRWALSGHLRSISGQIQAWSPGARARLRRMDPERPEPETGDVVSLLMAAGVPEVQWQDRRGTRRSREAADEGLIRWARVCHLMATLAGAAGREVHAPVQEWENGEPKGGYWSGREVGRVIHAARYSELRLMRLTSARGLALAAQARRLARFLAAAGNEPADLTPLADLLLWDDQNDWRADRARLDIARAYYKAAHEKAAQEAKNAKTGTKGTP